MNKNQKVDNTNSVLEDKRDRQTYVVSNHIVGRATCRTEVPTIYNKIRRVYRWLMR